jgi:nucleoside-diphosphate-sugar epimerase
MTALVTGATGFIGSHLTELLVRKGRRVVALVRPRSGTRRLQELGVEIHIGDVGDARCVSRAVEGCGQVFHLAGARPANTSDVSEYRRVNVEGTLKLARAALDAGVGRLVFASSVGVFGYIRRGFVDERTPTHPDTPYRASKLAAELRLLEMHRREGLPVTIARLSSVVGPGATSWLPFCRAIARKDFRLIGRGTNCVPIGHVSDAIEGLVRCADAPDVEGETFIITAGETITLCDCVAAIRRSIHSKTEPGQLPEAPFHVVRTLASIFFRTTGVEIPHARRYDVFLEDLVFDISKARMRLNYQPLVSPGEAVEVMARWYRQHGWLHGSGPLPRELGARS